MPADAESRVAPYVPFRTFINSLDYLRQQKLPSEINRTIWPSLSGTVIGQLLGTYRFLGLVDENGKPTTALQRIASNPDSQQEELNKLLQRAYHEVIAIGLDSASPKQVYDIFDAYNVSGATHQKAISFFIQAAQYANLPLSQYLTKRKGRRKRNGSRTPRGTEQLVELSVAPQGTTRSVELRSGGDITISLTFDAFTISTEDRKFVFGLIDQLNGYEADKSASTEKSISEALAARIKKLRYEGNMREARELEAQARTHGSSSTEGIGDDDVPF